MKFFLGYLFLLTSGLLVYLQVIFFLSTGGVGWARLVLLACLTIGSVLGGSLALETRYYFAICLAGGTAILGCLALILFMAYLVLENNLAIDGWELTLLALYALAWGIYGVRGLSGAERGSASRS
jgi:hypothetical protein